MDWTKEFSSLVVVVSRDEVETCDITRAMSTLGRLTSSRDIVEKYCGFLDLSVDGYNDDPRELFEIPEVRKYIKTLDETFPYWFHFIAKDTGTLRLLAFCLCNTTEISPGIAKMDPNVLGVFFEYHFAAMNFLYDHFGLSEESNYEVSQQVLRQFGAADPVN